MTSSLQEVTAEKKVQQVLQFLRQLHTKNIIRSCIGCCRQLVLASHSADKQETGINPLIKIGVSTMIVTLNSNLCAKECQAVFMTLSANLMGREQSLCLQSRLLKKKSMDWKAKKETSE